MKNSEEARRVSLKLQAIARELDQQLATVAGSRQTFTLFVWSEGRANYVSNAASRAEQVTAIKSIVDGWNTGMPDIPAHEVN